jgi:hypothetical protein
MSKWYASHFIKRRMSSESSRNRFTHSLLAPAILLMGSVPWDMAMSDKDGKPVKSKGKYAIVWKKQSNGDWKAVLDMENADQ